MTEPLRRAGAFAVVGTLSLVVPVYQVAAAVPFAAIAALAVFSLHDGPLFELFARPGDRRDRRLYGLIGFTLGAAGLVLLSAVTGMPEWIPVGAITLVAYGNFGSQLARRVTDSPVARTAAFAATGGLACGIGAAAAIRLADRDLAAAAPELVFLGAAAGLLGALLRTLLFESDDPHVMLTVGLWLWLLSELAVDVSVEGLAVGLAVTLVLGYLSYALETASIPGMLTGVTMALVTVVLGGFAWFATLVAFFAIGGLATKFRYGEKLDRGVAEDNEGARGAANVLANGAVAFAAVLAYAGLTAPGLSAPRLPTVTLPAALFVFAFAGSLATAMSDTLSSEVGGVFDNTRLITTLRPVEPGTDGGITWQGELAGAAGAGVVAAIAVGLFGAVGAAGAGVVVAAGVAGMTVDSLLGATVEGRLLGNAAVNFLATLSGGAVAAAGALALGLV